MKIIVSVMLLILGSCNHSNQCQVTVEELNICDKYNEAKWEIYKLYLGCLDKDLKSQDDFLANEIVFQSLDTILDSVVVISFDSKMMKQLADNNTCFYYIGIGFKKDSIVTRSWSDNVTVDYNKTDVRLDSIIKAVIVRNRKDLNPWFYKQSVEKGWLK